MQRRFDEVTPVALNRVARSISPERFLVPLDKEWIRWPDQPPWPGLRRSGGRQSSTRPRKACSKASGPSTKSSSATGARLERDAGSGAPPMRSASDAASRLGRSMRVAGSAGRDPATDPRNAENPNRRAEKCGRGRRQGSAGGAWPTRISATRVSSTPPLSTIFRKRRRMKGFAFPTMNRHSLPVATSSACSFQSVNMPLA